MGRSGSTTKDKVVGEKRHVVMTHSRENLIWRVAGSYRETPNVREGSSSCLPSVKREDTARLKVSESGLQMPISNEQATVLEENRSFLEDPRLLSVVMEEDSKTQ